MTKLKAVAQRVIPSPLYRWAWQVRQSFRRLVQYPHLSGFGAVDYGAYWEQKAGTTLGTLSRWRLRRAMALADCIEPESSVLDLGVGDGAILRYLVEHKNIDAFGLDISPEMIEFCRRQGLRVEVADLNRPIDMFLSGPFEYIVMSEIIEHLAYPESLLRQLRGYVRKSILISIPNTGFIEHRLRLMLGRFPMQWVANPGEHLRFWTDSDFRWWSGQMGFDIARVLPYEGVWLLREVWPNLFAAGIVYMLRVREATV